MAENINPAGALYVDTPYQPSTGAIANFNIALNSGQVLDKR